MIEHDKRFYCECGQKLRGMPTNHITNMKIVCPKCGKMQYIDVTPADWNRVANPNATTQGE